MSDLVKCDQCGKISEPEFLEEKWIHCGPREQSRVYAPPIEEVDLCSLECAADFFTDKLGAAAK